MKIYRSYIKQDSNIKNKRARLLKLAVFILVIGISACTLMSFNVNKNHREMVKAEKGTYHAIFSNLLSQEDLEKLNESGVIEKLGYQKEDVLKFQPKNKLVNILQADEHYMETYRGELIDGKLPEKEGEITLPQNFLEEESYRQGDQIKLENENGEIYNYEIVGSIYRPYKIYSNSFDAISYKNPQELEKNPESVMVWFSNINKTYDHIQNIIDEQGLDIYNQIQSGNLIINLNYLDVMFVRSDYLESTSSIKETQDIFLVLTIIFIIFFVFVIGALFMTWQEEDIKQYGIFMSIGSKTIDIVKIVLGKLIYATRYAVIFGIIIGSILQILLLNMMNRSLAMGSLYTLNEPIMEYSFYFIPKSYLILILIILGVLIFSSFRFFIKFRKLDPIEAINYKGGSYTSNKKRKLDINNFIGSYSKLTMSQYKIRFIPTIISIGICIFALSLLLAIDSGNVLEIKYDYKDRLKVYDAYVNFGDIKPIYNETIEAISSNIDDENLYLSEYTMKLNLENEEILNRDYLDNYSDNLLNITDVNNNLDFKLVAIDDDNFYRIAENLGLDKNEFMDPYNILLLNSYSTDVFSPYQRQDYLPLIKEGVSELNLTMGLETEEDTADNFTFKISGVTDDRDLLNIDLSTVYLYGFIPMSNSKVIFNDNEAMESIGYLEKIFLNLGEDKDLKDVKNIIDKYEYEESVEYYNDLIIKTENDSKLYFVYTILLFIGALILLAGFSSVYATISAINRSRINEYRQLIAIGMDKSMLEKLAIKDVNFIYIRILITSLILSVIAFIIGSQNFSKFSFFEILIKSKLFVLFIALAVIYIIIRKIYFSSLERLSISD